MSFKKMVTIIFLSLFSLNTYAQNSKSVQDEEALVNDAVKSSQDLLINSDKRNEVIKSDPKAKAADDKVKYVTGGDDIQTQRIYSISSEILPVLMKEAGNDPAKAAKLLESAQRDPAAFLNSLPQNIRDEIKAVSGDIEKKNTSKKAP